MGHAKGGEPTDSGRDKDRQIPLFLPTDVEYGAECNCDRCGIRCRVTGAPNPNATMLRVSAKPKGVCINCHVTEWMMNNYPLNMQLEEYGPEILLRPGMTEQFAPLMKVHHAQASPDEINWQIVVENWHLPVTVKRSATNPWMPGEALAMKLEEMEYGLGKPSPLEELRGLGDAQKDAGK